MRQMWRLLLLIGLALWASLSVVAEEEIRSFDVRIDVEQDGDILVTETIAVNVEGRDIRRGIFRDLPAYYADPDGPGKLRYRYTVLDVRKDGQREPHTKEIIDNAMQIRIGDPDVYLDYRVHEYVIQYHVRNEI